MLDLKGTEGTYTGWHVSGNGLACLFKGDKVTVVDIHFDDESGLVSCNVKKKGVFFGGVFTVYGCFIDTVVPHLSAIEKPNFSALVLLKEAPLLRCYWENDKSSYTVGDIKEWCCLKDPVALAYTITYPRKGTFEKVRYLRSLYSRGYFETMQEINLARMLAFKPPYPRGYFVGGSEYRELYRDFIENKCRYHEGNIYLVDSCQELCTLIEEFIDEGE